jgi:hypothetical protein
LQRWGLFIVHPAGWVTVIEAFNNIGGAIGDR